MLKDKELKEVKERSAEYRSQTDDSLDSQRRELQVANKRCSNLQAETKRLKEELRSCLQDREGLLEEIQRLRDDEFRTHKDLEDYAAHCAQLQDEKAQWMRERDTLGKENGRATPSKFHRLRSEVTGLKTHNFQLVEELRLKTNQVSILQQQVANLCTGSQSEEVTNLSNALARIADFVFSLPCVSANPEEASLVESTIRAVSSIYQDLQAREEELSRLRRTSKGDVHKSHTPPYRDPIARYHALLQASSIKPGEFLSPNSKPRPK